MSRTPDRTVRVFIGARRRADQEVAGIRSWRYQSARPATSRDFYNTPAPYTSVGAGVWTVVASFAVDDLMLERLRQAARRKTVIRITGGNDLIAEEIEGRIHSFRKLKGDRYRFTLEPLPMPFPAKTRRPKPRPRKRPTPKTERNRKILRAYRGRPRPTFKTLARRFRISPSRVGQIIARGRP